jgi:hypothetical protein
LHNKETIALPPYLEYLHLPKTLSTKLQHLALTMYQAKYIKICGLNAREGYHDLQGGNSQDRLGQVFQTDIFQYTHAYLSAPLTYK